MSRDQADVATLFKHLQFARVPLVKVAPARRTRRRMGEYMKSIIVSRAALALSLAFASPALADEGEGDSIVVTGTRIVRDGYEAPTPVTVASTEELSRSTPSSIPDGLNKLPQFQNSLSLRSVWW